MRHAFPPGPPFHEIVAAFTTRYLGDKNSPSDNLNTGLHTGDDPLSVLENRRLIFGTLKLEADSFTAAKQVHGSNVHRVTEQERGRGARNHRDAIPATDAMITDIPDLPIGVFTADCVPIFLYDPTRMAVGIVHAGWRSTAESIAQKTVSRMNEAFGSNPKDIWASLGPSIGPCCYEVGQDVYDEFSGTSDEATSLFRRTNEDKWHLDLWLANRQQLEGCGLNSEMIIDTAICSACNSHEYFSARKLGPHAARTLSVIAIKPSIK